MRIFSVMKVSETLVAIERAENIQLVSFVFSSSMLNWRVEGRRMEKMGG